MRIIYHLDNGENLISHEGKLYHGFLPEKIYIQLKTLIKKYYEPIKNQVAGDEEKTQNLLGRIWQLLKKNNFICLKK